MVFGIKIGIDGQPICPCCREFLWHCKRCWDRFHNGEKHKDYDEPEYYGQSMFGEITMREEYKKIMKEIKKRKVKHLPDKTIKWEGGMYGH